MVSLQPILPMFRKLASKAGFLLSELLVQHPVMKPVVAREVGWTLVMNERG